MQVKHLYVRLSSVSVTVVLPVLMLLATLVDLLRRLAG